ncbi:PPE domain-containing protein [Nocardia paucivorans]|uniref:PPE domain-containing protein n=1 Tax=Nocardia paucivorans TaxID=114259 RepID=UPI0002D9B236|nr:PPE domain-containing protein [Nocardia paucivorans]
MTAGITGVFWLPRLAEGNSIALNAGTHAIPMSAAATAWGTLTGAWADATFTVARVLAELGIGMQGFNGLGALARLAGFTAWSEQQSTMAAALGTKAASQATAYTVASIAMPSLPEIAAVNAARIAAHTTGGVLNGSAEAAEAAKAALDLRAALTMETYEAAISATVMTPGEFVPPPPIANGAGRADTPSLEEGIRSANGDPVQMAAAAAGALANNPGIMSGVTQAANVAGSVATTGVTTVGNIGANAIVAATTTSTPSAATMIAPGALSTGLAAAAAAATRSAGLAGGTATGLHNGSLKLPEGWGAPPAAGSSTTPLTEGVGAARTENMAVRPAATGGPNPLLGNTARDDEEETGHKGSEYRQDDLFTDGRYVADGVIGAEPPRMGK